MLANPTLFAIAGDTPDEQEKYARDQAAKIKKSESDQSFMIGGKMPISHPCQKLTRKGYTRQDI